MVPALVPALLLQQNRALSWLGPEQNHLAGRRQQHVNLALMKIGVNEKVEASWMNCHLLNPPIAQHEIRHCVVSRTCCPRSPHHTGLHRNCPAGDQAC